MISRISYSFLGLLPSSESLAIKGARLQDTPQQRQSKVYGPNSFLKVEVIDNDWRLNLALSTNSKPTIYLGEESAISLKITNTGTKCIRKIWLVQGPEDLLWLLPSNSDGTVVYLKDSQT